MASLERAIVLVALICGSACKFNVDANVPIADLTQVGDDLSMVEEDMAVAAPDLAAPDLTPPPPDLSIGFPSHVPWDFVHASTFDWTVVADVTIDTSAMTITPTITFDTALPTGGAQTANAIFAVHSNIAVLAVHDLVIGTNNLSDVTSMRVVGSRPLVIVSGESITIYGNIQAGAEGDVPGPGGSSPANGMGAGTAGAIFAVSGSGGSGGSFGSMGAQGGPAMEGGIAKPGPNGGSTYGEQTYPPTLRGGSGGGSGTIPGGISCLQAAKGGAGGGALQLSARVGIYLDTYSGGFASTPHGVIGVGGGGGSGGCQGPSAGSGGGGGSGGQLILEAPSIDIANGALAAAGGGGGGGGNNAGVAGRAGRDGSRMNALLHASLQGKGSNSTAAGADCDWTNRANCNANAGGKGDSDWHATFLGPAAVGGAAPADSVSAGGGGGGNGWIYMRSATPVTFGTRPAAPVGGEPYVLDTTLPATIN